jgi:alpha-1,6-mannosyltransferase
MRDALPSMPKWVPESLLIFVISSLYAILCPFSKVEESFHTQATHDILVHGTSLSSYDHNEFPGVVPRTFLGAVALSIPSWPLKVLFSFVGAPKIFLQLAVRLCLAGAISWSYWRLFRILDRWLGASTTRCVSIIAVLTPHFMFYVSRLLPNTFAIFMILNGVTDWIKMEVSLDEEAEKRASPPLSNSSSGGITASKEGIQAGAPCPSQTSFWFPLPLIRSLSWFVFAALWLRCDMVVLMGPIGLVWLARGHAGLPVLLWTGTWLGVVGLAATVGIDSYFWRRPIWPEGEVLLFNVVHNRSSEYGTSPFLWYFLGAIPKAWAALLVLIPLGLFLRVVPSEESIGRGGSDSQRLQPPVAAALSFLDRVVASVTRMYSAFFPPSSCVTLLVCGSLSSLVQSSPPSL